MSAHPEKGDTSTVDVIIVGGGMVGASLALGLAGTGVSTMLIEGVEPGSQAQPSFDDRTTALGNASRRIFQSLGVWPLVESDAAAIRTIHVSDAGRFGFARLKADEQGIDAFGYVVANRVIGAALWKRLREAEGIVLRTPASARNVNIATDGTLLEVVAAPDRTDLLGRDRAGGTVEPVRAKLIVAADGAHSIVRAAAGIEASVEDYDQIAVVANVAADRPHDGTAYERFTPSGPLAVLPLQDGSYGVIWTAAPERANEIVGYDDVTYLAELQMRFGWRAGKFVRVGKRASYPLKLSRSQAVTATRTVLIGNAAQALHPVAGQGFNLGLRDAAMLAELVVASPADPGAPEVLERFAGWRAKDREGVIRFTDGLVKLFGDGRPGVGTLRNLGLLLFDVTPPAKSALARVSAGFGGPAPRLARGLAIR
jgi:2-octaprenyl-6-methoxyphenol hydroxylase